MLGYCGGAAVNGNLTVFGKIPAGLLFLYRRDLRFCTKASGRVYICRLFGSPTFSPFVIELDRSFNCEEMELGATRIEIGDRPKAGVLQLVNPLGALEEIAAANRDDRAADFWEQQVDFSACATSRKADAYEHDRTCRAQGRTEPWRDRAVPARVNTPHLKATAGIL